VRNIVTWPTAATFQETQQVVGSIKIIIMYEAIFKRRPPWPAPGGTILRFLPGLLTKGMSCDGSPYLARKIAAITLIVWNKGAISTLNN